VPGAPGNAFLPGRRPDGRGICGCFQMARTAAFLISRRRGTLAIWCKREQDFSFSKSQLEGMTRLRFRQEQRTYQNVCVEDAAQLRAL
jgi:hypothetical protein